MNAWKLTTSIPENRKLSLDIPSDVPVGPVEVILVYDREPVKNRNNIIDSACGSLEGSSFNTERFIKHKRDEKELER